LVATPTRRRSGQSAALLKMAEFIYYTLMSGTLRSWIHYIDLRSGNGTQKEHMEIALECAREIAKVFPMISEL
jgi:hypothetical protein